MKYLVEQEVLQATLGYLQNQKYAEVAKLITLLSQAQPEKIIPKKEEEKEAKK